MTDLKIFTYGSTPLRTVEHHDGEIWWVLRDVCDILHISRTSDVSNRLEEDEKGVAQISTPGGCQEMLIVNEPGLYNVILRSDKPEAKDFKRWVTHEVLPAIRQTGKFQMQPMTPAEQLAAQAQLLVEMERKVDAVQGQTRALEAKVDTAIKAFSRPAKDHWQGDMDRAIKELCEARHLSVVRTKGAMYADLEERANCNVNSRLAALKRRMKKTGMRYRDVAALTKLDAVAADKKLRAIFEEIVREWQARAVPVSEAAEVFEPVEVPDDEED